MMHLFRPSWGWWLASPNRNSDFRLLNPLDSHYQFVLQNCCYLLVLQVTSASLEWNFLDSSVFILLVEQTASLHEDLPLSKSICHCCSTVHFQTLLPLLHPMTFLQDIYSLVTDRIRQNIRSHAVTCTVTQRHAQREPEVTYSPSRVEF